MVSRLIFPKHRIVMLLSQLKIWTKPKIYKEYMPNYYMYLRKKKIKGKNYYYLVEYSKKDNKVVQKIVAYLGNAENIRKVFKFYKEHKLKAVE